MSDLNKVMIIGRLGKDPEMRETQAGKAIANLTVATSEKWNDRDGERQERVEWHRVTAFDKLAEIIGQYLRKGSQVYIEGKLQTRKWQTKDGQDRYTTEIIAQQMQMLGGKPEGRREEPRERSQPASATVDDDGFSDDIPF